MKKKNKKRLVIGLLCGTILLCMVYFGVWLANYHSYNKYIGEGLTKLSYSPNSFVDWSSDIICGVKKPSLFSFTGNLTCVSDDDRITILFWPNFMSTEIRSIGIVVTDDEKQVSYMAYVDEKLTFDEQKNKERGYTEEEAETMKKIISSVSDEVESLYLFAKEKFNLDN